MLWTLFLFVLVAHTGGETSDTFRIVCYYTNWAQYRAGKGTFFPEDVDPSLCTIISYAFARPEGLDLKAFEWNDVDSPWAKGMYSRVMKLKEQNPSVKVILAVGGYKLGSTPFIPLIQTAESRETFTRNTITFLRDRNFDGFDMDWEYPGAFGSSPSDKPLFQMLMEKMWADFHAEAQASGKPRLLLGVAVAAGKENIDNGYFPANLSECVDFISIMTYDFHGAWENFVGFNSPLFAHTAETETARNLNVDWAVNYYVSLGAPKEKLNIGIATYGRSFTLADPNHHDILSAATGKGLPGIFTREAGVLAYYEVCEMIYSGATVVEVLSQRNRYAYKDNQWVGYDDVDSVTEKACYAKQGGYGGILIWSLDFDDFKGTSCNSGRYPLVTAMVNAVRSPGNVCPRARFTGLAPTVRPQTVPETGLKGFRTICYYSNMAQYRPGQGQYVAEDVDVTKCSIISYAFAKPEGLDLKASEWNDEDSTWAKGMYSRIMKLKEQNPSVKVILAVGGNKMGSTPFIPLVQTAESRTTFTKNAIKFLRDRDFDGFDMDWEYPCAFGSLSSDKPKFQMLMEELWRSFHEEAIISGKPRLILGVAVAAGKGIIDKAYYIGNLSRCVDFISILSYDFHGAWENVVGFNSPLYAYAQEKGSARYLNVDWAARYYVSQGAPKEKLNIGLATYGRSFTLVNHDRHGILSAATGAGIPGTYTREDGILAYYEICDFIKSGAKVVKVNSQRNPYAHSGSQWVGYDDIDSITEKVCYAKEKGFGGIILWSLDSDDFKGQSCNQGINPLLNAVYLAVQPTSASICAAERFNEVSSNSWQLEKSQASEEFRIICYYTNWPQYRPTKGKFVPEDVDPNLCTIISYAFAKPEGLDLKGFQWNDEDSAWSKGMYSRILKLKDQNPKLKVILAVGGYKMGSKPFIPLVRTEQARKTFAQNAVKYLRDKNFDGIDMAWEYPTRNGSLPSDKEHFQYLMEELWTAFQDEAAKTEKPRLLLGVAAAAGKSTIDDAYFASDLSRYTDFISLMTYDFHGSWDNFVGFNSPLYADESESGPITYLNVDWVARYYMSLGVPKEKLNIGIATYGRSFTLAEPRIHAVRSPALTSGLAGQFTHLDGVLAYYEICDFISTGATIVDATSQRNPYAVRDNQWVGYDDPKSAAEKACYAVEKGFGGVVIWSLDFDDFKGEFCNEGKYPITRAIFNAVTNPERACSCFRTLAVAAASMSDMGSGLERQQATDVKLLWFEVLFLLTVTFHHL